MFDGTAAVQKRCMDQMNDGPATTWSSPLASTSAEVLQTVMSSWAGQLMIMSRSRDPSSPQRCTLVGDRSIAHNKQTKRKFH